MTRRYARLNLDPREPAIFSERAATEGAHRTLLYPPGAALLGWAAAKGRYEKYKDPFRLFHSGRVRFSNAIPVLDGQEAFPAPRILMHRKGADDFLADGRFVPARLTVGRPKLDTDTQYEAIAKDYLVTPSGLALKPHRKGRLRTATANGRAARGQLFGYTHLEPVGQGAPLRYAASIEADDPVGDEDWNRLLNAFDGKTLQLGRGSGAAYGGSYVCNVVRNAKVEHANKIKIASGQAVMVWVLSDLALVDEFGTPCAVPPSETFGLPKGGRLLSEASAISLRRYAPWNGHLGCRDVERQVIEAGSVIAYEPFAEEQEIEQRQTLGLWREAGLGQVWIAPPMLSTPGEHPKLPEVAYSAGRTEHRPARPAFRPEDFWPQIVEELRKYQPPPPRRSAEPTTLAADASALHVMRVTLEALTPLSIASGEGLKDSDVDLVRDARGLPMIPGASVQGALRHLWRECEDKKLEGDLFGCIDARDDNRSRAGRIIFGMTLPHDSNNEATSWLSSIESIAGGKDDVLSLLREASPVKRDHVKLNNKHVVEGRHKFDRSAVPVGTRFSMEWAMWGNAEDADDDRKVLIRVARLMSHPRFRLGGAGRRGYGVIELKSVTYARPDIRDAAALQELRLQPPSRTLIDNVSNLCKANFTDSVGATIVLRPFGLWRVGADQTPKSEEATPRRTEPAGRRSPALTAGTQGIRLKGDRSPTGSMYRVTDKDKAPDTRDTPSAGEDDHTLRLLREPRIVWNGEAGIAERPSPTGPFRFPVPGSAIKGPLAHRAVFHWNRIKGNWIDPDADTEQLDRLNGLAQRPEELEELLGTAKEENTKHRQAARVYFQDGLAENVVAVQAVTHNSIDRFTSGVRTGALYTEEVAIGGEIALQMTIASPQRGGEWQQDVQDAFLHALFDLTSGRLAFGAKSHGFCNGEVRWSGSAGGWAERWRAVQALRGASS